MFGFWPAIVSSSSSEASWAQRTPPQLRLVSHLRGAIGGLHPLGQDSILFGVADRPRLESEYTFNKTLLERRPIERIESYMYFVTVTHYFPSAGQSIDAGILTRGELIDCCGLFAGQPFEKPLCEHTRSVLELGQI